MNAFRHSTSSTDPQVVAHKFGGSSLADAGRIRHVAQLIRDRRETTQIVVVSAMQKVTDTLIALASGASSQADWRSQLTLLRDRHLTTADELLGTHSQAVRDWLDAQFDELAEMLHAISVLGSASREISDAISGLGEVWSAQLMHAYLQLSERILRIARCARRARRASRGTRRRRRLGRDERTRRAMATCASADSR